MKMYAKYAMAMAVLCSCASVKAAILFSDTFTYANGTQLSTVAGTNNGWKTSSGLGTNNITVTGGVAPLTTNGEDIYSALSAPQSPSASPGTSLYYSADITVSAVQSTGDYFIHYKDVTTAAGSFFTKLFAKSTTGGYLLGITGTSNTGNYGTTVLTLNTSYHVVVGWNLLTGTANDTVNLYVNPTSNTEASNTVYKSIAFDGTEPATAASIALRQGTAGNAPTEKVDNLIVATTFSEVSGVVATSSVSLTDTGTSTLGAAVTVNGTDAGGYLLGEKTGLAGVTSGTLEITGDIKTTANPVLVYLDLNDPSATFPTLSGVTVTSGTFDFGTGRVYDKLLTFSASNNTADNFYFNFAGLPAINNIAIIPEPTSFASLLAPLGFLAARRRRRA